MTNTRVLYRLSFKNNAYNARSNETESGMFTQQQLMSLETEQIHTYNSIPIFQRK